MILDYDYLGYALTQLEMKLVTLLNRSMKLCFYIVGDVTMLRLYTGFMFFTKCIQI